MVSSENAEKAVEQLDNILTICNQMINKDLPQLSNFKSDVEKIKKNAKTTRDTLKTDSGQLQQLKSDRYPSLKQPVIADVEQHIISNIYDGFRDETLKKFNVLIKGILDNSVKSIGDVLKIYDDHISGQTDIDALLNFADQYLIKVGQVLKENIPQLLEAEKVQSSTYLQDIPDITLEHKSEVINCGLIIDQYNNSQASEIRDLLQNNKRSNYNIPNEFYLTGKDATYRQIQVALSKIFRQDNEYALVFFYFRGYWFVHSAGETYLSSVDIDNEDPFISGLSLKTLKDIISNSANKSKQVIMIIDCYYSKSIQNSEQVGELNSNFYNSLRNLSDSNRIIIGSCEGEITGPVIEGLRGMASDDFGIITLSQIRSQERLKRKAAFFPEDPQESEDVQILVTENYDTKAKEVIDKIDRTCQECKTGKYSDRFLFCVLDATKKLKKLRQLERKNETITNIAERFHNIIDVYLTNLEDKITSWLAGDGNQYFTTINEAAGGLYQELEQLAQSLSFEQIDRIKPTPLYQLNLLILLIDNVLSIKTFTDKIRPTKAKIIPSPLKSGFKRPSGTGSAGG